VSHDPTVLASIEGLVRARQKIQAIKEWRGISGYGLKEAKDAVEHFEQFGSWRPADLGYLTERHGAAMAELAERERAFAHAHAEDPSQAMVVKPPELEDPDLSEIVETARAGQKIQAIKLYRERFGVGLKEAKDIVEALVLGRPLPVQPPSTDRAAYTAPRSHEHEATVLVTPSAAPDDAEQRRAREALAHKIGNTEKLLFGARGESGLFKGYLFLTEEHLCFVADRYGSLEVTENLERKELESIEVRRDPFGFELAVRAGFHSAHFSELNEQQARTFEALLKGQPAPVIQHQPAAREPHRHATHHDPSAANPSSASQQRIVGPATPFGADEGTTKPKAFSVGRVLVLGALAGLPLAVYGSMFRFFPMHDFPDIAHSVLYWSTLALGGMLRGHGVKMLRVALVMGAVSWALGLTGMSFQSNQLVAIAILGATYGHAQANKAALLGAFLVLPVAVLNALLTVVVNLVEYVPMLAFSFWLVHFGVEDYRASRAKPAAAKTA
jgi:ribosomal protein L7/L12